MVSLEQFRRAYLLNNPEAEEQEIARNFLEFVGAPQFLSAISDPVDEASDPESAAEFGHGIQRSVGMAIEGVGAAMRILGGEELGRQAVDMGQAMAAEAPRHPELQGWILDSAEGMKDPAWWAAGLGEMAPFLAGQLGITGSLLGAGVKLLPATLAGATAASSFEGLPLYNKLVDEKGVDTGEAIARTGANVAGISLLNSIAPYRAFGGPSNNVLRKVMATAVTEGTTETLEEPLEALLAGEDPAQALYQGANVFPVAALTGGLMGGAGAMMQGQPQQAQQPAQQQQQGPIIPGNQGQVDEQIDPQIQQAVDQSYDTIAERMRILNDTPLNRQVQINAQETQFDDQGAPIEQPSTGWQTSSMDGQVTYAPRVQLKDTDINFDLDNTLETVVDNPQLFQDYPSLSNVAVGALPTGLKMQSRSVPGRIEISPRLHQQDMVLALSREIKRQIAYTEGLTIPGTPQLLEPGEKENIIGDLLEDRGPFIEAEDLDFSTRAGELFLQHELNKSKNATPLNINEITDDQGNVNLSFSQKEARVLAQARYLGLPPFVQAQETPTQEQAAPEAQTDGLQPVLTDETASSEAAPSPAPARLEPIEGEEGPAEIELPTKIGNFRLDKYETSGSNKEAMFEMGRLEDEFINRRRRMPEGKSRSIAQINKDAVRILADESGATMKQLLKSRVGEVFNDAEFQALRMSMGSVTRQFRRANHKYIEEPTKANRLAAMQAFTNMRHVQSLISGSASEAGRVLRVMREIANEDEQLAVMSKVYDNFDDMMSALAAGKTPKEINSAAARFERATKTDVVFEVWLSNLLTGLTTHQVNLASNWAVGAMYRKELWLAWGLGKLKGQDEINLRDVIAYNSAHWADAVEALKAAKEAWVTEADTFDTTKLEAVKFKAISSRRLGLKKDSWFVDFVGKTIRIPFRALQAGDAYFKTRAYRRRIRQMVTHEVLKKNPKATSEQIELELEAVFDDPPGWMYDDAKLHAQDLTFTRKTGAIAGSVKNLTSNYPFLKVVFPFIDTPANIVKFAFRRTPFALMMGEPAADLRGDNGHERQLMAQSAMLMGTSLAILAYQFASTGMITGGPPHNPRKRSMWFARNMQAYSVNIDGTWVNYGRYEPLGMLLGLSADFVTLRDELDPDDPDLVEFTTALAFGFARNLQNKTWTQGMADLVLAVVDPERYAKPYMQGIAGSVVPTGVAHYTRSEDPYLRYTTTLMERIQSRLPNNEIAMRVDVWGDEISLMPEGASTLENFLRPVYLRKFEDDSLGKEMMRLESYMSVPRKKIGEYEMTPDEYVEYSKILGKISRAMLEAKTNTPDFIVAPDGVRKRMIERTRRKASDLSRKIFYKLHPEIVSERERLDLEALHLYEGLDLRI